MAKALFISLYNKDAIGIAQLSACLKEGGHESSVVFLKKYSQVLKSRVTDEGEFHTMIDNFGRDLVLAYNSPISDRESELLLELVDRIQPDFIGISVTTVVMPTAIIVTEKIKERFAGLPVVWGGIAPSIEPERCLAYADIVCVGEGEKAVCALARALDEKRPIDKIENLWLKKDGELIQNPRRPLIQDLDSLPFPDIAFDDKYFITDDKIFQGAELMMALSDGFYETVTARGCPFQCSYCCNGQIKGLYPNQKYVRRRSVDHVIAELEMAKECRRPYFIYFHDDIFTFNKQWVEEFARSYKERIALPFYCNIHPRYTKEETVRILKGAGLYEMICGIQTGSENLANSVYKRQVKNEDIVECSRLLRRLGVRHSFDIITNNPLETEDDCRETLELLLTLPRPVLNNGLSKLSFFPGTELTGLIVERGLSGAVDEDMFAFYNRLYLLTQLRLGRGFIRRLSRNKFLRRRPRLLDFFFIGRRAKLELKEAIKKFIPRQFWLGLKKRLLTGSQGAP